MSFVICGQNVSEETRRHAARYDYCTQLGIFRHIGTLSKSVSIIMIGVKMKMCVSVKRLKGGNPLHLSGTASTLSIFY